MRVLRETSGIYYALASLLDVMHLLFLVEYPFFWFSEIIPVHYPSSMRDLKR